MNVTNIIRNRVKRFKSLLSLIGESRSQLPLFTTTKRNGSRTEQVFPCGTSQLDGPVLQEDASKIKLLFHKPQSDFLGAYSFVTDDAVADAVARQVARSIKKNRRVTVIEINPGYGKITKNLLENGIQKVFVCEINNLIWTKKLHQQYKQKISMHYYQNKFENFNKLDKILPKFLLQSQGHSQVIILINASRMFIRNLFETITFVDFRFLAKHKLFILVSDLIFSDSTLPASELLDYGFIDVIFDVKVLAEFPRTAVLPPPLVKFKKMYLVRLKRKMRPRVSQENLIMYWNFVNILSKKKNTPVLACLEKWIPGCGPLLIANGLSVFTKLRELSRSDVLTIFEILLSDTECRFAMTVLKEDNIALK